MRKLSFLLALAAMLPAGRASAQLELPRPSQNAKVWQLVGLTEVTVEYSSPAVRGRTIWGGLVPYDKLWRTGANAATKLTVNKDVTIAGKPVPAGSYSIFTIPGASSWTVIVNKNASASTGSYKEAEDVVRFSATPKAIAHRERLAFIVSDATDDGASLDLEWEKVRVSIPLQVATATQALASIKASTDNAWRPWNAAARYALDTKKDADWAMRLVDTSVALRQDWQNLWTRALVLRAKGKTKDARASAQKAYDLGKKSEGFFFEADVKKALDEWKK